MNGKHAIIVTGAQGRIGRLIRLFERAPEYRAFSMHWAARSGSAGLIGWDMTDGRIPDLPKGGILLHLAAQLPGPGRSGDLDDNIALARAVVAADRTAAFAHVVFLSSVAVYAPQPTAIRETVPPAPQSGYGRAKLAAENQLASALGERLTILRLANLAGADALLGVNRAAAEVVLDPVEGQNGGPIRSYIGPASLAKVLAHLLDLAAGKHPLPPVLNLAQRPAVAMADLLQAAGLTWQFGPHRSGVIPKVEVDVSLLHQICPLQDAEPAGIVAELKTLKGRWP